jgi:putative transposase
MVTKEPYPSDLTEKDWNLIVPLLPRPKRLGQPPRYSKRAIFHAIFYVVRGVCSWRCFLMIFRLGASAITTS